MVKLLKTVDVNGQLLRTVDVDGQLLRTVDVDGQLLRTVDVDGQLLRTIDINGQLLTYISTLQLPSNPRHTMLYATRKLVHFNQIVENWLLIVRLC